MITTPSIDLQAAPASAYGSSALLEAVEAILFCAANRSTVCPSRADQINLGKDTAVPAAGRGPVLAVLRCRRLLAITACVGPCECAWQGVTTLRDVNCMVEADDGCAPLTGRQVSPVGGDLSAIGEHIGQSRLAEAAGGGGLARGRFRPAPGPVRAPPRRKRRSPGG